jgi:hypothetical protein
VANAATIDDFVKAVFGAVASGDCARISGVIGYPLVVNATDPDFHQNRSFDIETKGAFLKHCPAIFTAEFRAAILRHQGEGVSCSTAQLGLARGRLWSNVYDDGPLINKINQERFRWPNMTAGELLRCRTRDSLIVVDRPRAEVRYRSWSPDQDSKEKPKVLIEAGDETWEGTGVCRHPTWSFPSGPDKIEISAFGCTDDEEKEVVAHRSILKGGKDASPSETWEKCRSTPPDAGAPEKK